MSMKTIIFEPQVTGHHVEYTNHLYLGALSHPEREYVFVLPRDFEEKRHLYEWPEAKNIVIEIDDELESLRKGKQIVSALKLSIALRKAVRRHKADKVFLITLSQNLPMTPLLMPSGVLVSGIQYNILLYEKGTKARIRSKLFELITTYIPQLERVFILNDASATERLNKKNGSTRFVCLPDPMKDIDCGSLRDIRSELKAEASDKVLLHFGAMGGRKGTLAILQAIGLMSDEELKDKVFVFAGKIDEDALERFDSLVAQEEGRARIVVYRGFCENELLHNLCYSCDYILMPYLQAYRSSGVVGYGLIGSIFKSYTLGKALDNVTAESVAQGIRELTTQGYPTESIGRYAEEHTVRDFTDVIFKTI